MPFLAPDKCADYEHIIVGDKIMFSTEILKTIVEERIILQVKEIKVKDDGTKEIWVSTIEVINHG